MADTLKFVPAEEGEWELPERAKSYSGCQHYGKTYDTKLRTIECNHCGKLLDPFESFLDVINHWKSLEHKLQHLKELEARMRRCDTIKKKSCKHSRAMVHGNGEMYCPSCDSIIPASSLKKKGS